MTVGPEEFAITHSLPMEIPPADKPIDLKSRNALARTLTPGYMHLRPEDYSDITPHMVERAVPELLRPDLIRDRKTDDELEVMCEVTASPGEPRRFVYVGVLSREHTLMNGRIATAGTRSMARTLTSRLAIGQMPAEDTIPAANRSGVHTVTNLLESMNRYRVNDLGQTLIRIHRFQEAANHKGLARFGNEGNMRIELAALREFTFGSMLTVIGLRRGWTAQQMDLVKRTLDVRFFMLDDKRTRVANFKGMLDLAEEWTLLKQAIIKGRISDAKKYLKEHKAEDQPTTAPA